MNNRLSQISIVINGVLVIAVGILFWLHFSGPSAETTEEVEGKDSTVMVKPDLPEIRSVNGPIAYIDLEKVLDGYKFFKDRRSQLEAELEVDKKRIQQKKEKFEAAYMKAQQEYSTMTQLQMQLRSEELGKMEEDMAQEMENFEKKTVYLNEKLKKEWLSKIDDYLKGLSKEKNYSYVVTYVKGDYAAIVYANDSLNVTDQVLSGLNAEYSKNKKK
jgi:outer membrane protein